MRLTPGQAARKGAAEAAGRAGRLVHGLIQLVVVLGIVSLVGATVLAIRLAQAPLPMAGLARQLAAAASTPEQTVHIGGAALTWEGLHGGLDRPLDIVLHDVALTNAAGQTEMSVARAEVSLSLLDAFLGRPVAREIALDRPILNLDLAVGTPLNTPKSPEGDWRGQLAETLQALRSPASRASGASALLAQLHRLKLTNASLSMHDDALGVRGNLSDVDIDVLRGASGGASFHLSATLNLGGGHVTWRANGDLLASTGDVVLSLAIDRFNPSWLASDMAMLDALNLVQLPLSMTGTARLDQHLMLRNIALDFVAERGSLLLADGVLPLRSANLHASLTPGQLLIQLRDAVLQATDASQPTHASALINARLPSDGTTVAADVTVDIDQVSVNDLPALWPLGMGGPGTRPWLVANAHNGVLSHGHAAVSLTAPLDFSDATVSKLSGGIDGSDISISWLSPVPPVEHSGGHLVFVDPDTMDIVLTGGKQANTQLVTKSGKLRMIGLAAHDQFLTLDADISGPFGDLIQLLNHKRIRLLDKGNITIKDPSGQITGKLSVNLPLKTDLAIEEVMIHGAGQVSDAHVGAIAGGRDIDHAALNFDVNNAGLTLNGTADVAAIPSQLTAMMDFRPGGPAEILQKVDLTSSFTGEQLTKFNANPDSAMSGAASAKLTYIERRGGANELALAVDFTKAAFADTLLAWSKKPGTPGQFVGHAELRNGQITSIDRLSADAPGLTLRAHAETASGKPSVLHIDTLKLGETTDVTGTLHLPSREGEPTQVNLTGPRLDVSGLLKHHDADDTKRGPAYGLDIHVDQATMAEGVVWKNLAARLDSDGWITNHADVSAIAGSGKTLLLISQGKEGRVLHTSAEDAGAMLGGLDISHRVAGGKLVADGRYDDSNASHKLSGTATMEDFRLPNAPAIGRLLQALSVYGIIEAASGSGLGLTRMTAPFDLTSHTLTLKEVRAISASLGFTSKGTVNLDAHTAQIEGTVIPLYFFNSLLGRLPLVGKLFSPETEGGLVAVGFSIRGNLDDPDVAVNPLSALTPGFLRGFFDLFPAPSAASPPLPSATP